MFRPVGIFLLNLLAGPFVDGSCCERLHGDAVLNRADIDAKIAADAFFLDHFEMPPTIQHGGDRLMRRVLAGNMAASALDARILVDLRLGNIVEIEILPVGHIGDRAPDHVIECLVTLFG